MANRLKRYEHRIRVFQRKLDQSQAQFTTYYRLKLGVFWCGLLLLSGSIYWQHIPMSFGIGSLGVFLFIFADIRQVKQLKRLRYFDALIQINREALQRLNGEWQNFKDTGADFGDTQHPFTADLDIFGANSLFQWINCAHTCIGRRRLAAILSVTPESIATIQQRQAAVSELAGLLWWRQRFQAEARLIAEVAKEPAALIQWAAESQRFFHSAWTRLALRLLPVFTLIWAAATFILKLPAGWLVGLLVIHFGILYYRGPERELIMAKVAPYQRQLQGLGRLFARLENRPFRASLTRHLRAELQVRGKAAHQQIAGLARIADAMSNRHNAFHFVLNLITLWDYHCLFALEDWKEQAGSHLAGWLEVLGELEALSSLAVVGHDHPEWAIPSVAETGPVYHGVNLGHPLLPEQRVGNDLLIRTPGEALLITGSNMSGKSTYLRTAGINLVLAYAGAPVCAGSLRCTLAELYTCMRISDQLTRNISSFYAEILRIKQIVDATKAGKTVFFLLDEIFRGTNSLDRHAGARVLITKLSRSGASGLVSTHDLELAELEKSSHGRIKNFHFQERYQNGQILFDYRLRPGVSTTRNALFLIRSAGIEIDETKDLWQENP